MAEGTATGGRLDPGERVEIALAVALTALTWPLAPALLPAHTSVGHLLLGLSALLLAQSLLRDLWLLARSRRAGGGGPRRVARCMCVESTVGATGVVAGAAALAAGVDGALDVPPWGWAACVGAVLAGGFLIKDLVLEWSPWRLRRDKDHVNVVVSWRR